jgi:xanthine dehydrogenase accessory factor
VFDFLEEAHRLQQLAQPFVLAMVVRAERPTSAKPGAKAIVTADGKLTGWVGGNCAQPTVVRQALTALQDGQPRFIRLCPPEQIGIEAPEGIVVVPMTCASGGTLDIYLEPQLPQPHVLALGHLPVIEALSRLGKAMGYRVTVMGLGVSHDFVEQADAVHDHLDFNRAGIAITPNTFVVVASHGNYDEDALLAAMQSGASHIALVASPKRSEAMRQFLRESGVSEAQIARLKGPAGLDIGAVTPEEIALSILAEIVQSLRQRTIAPAFGSTEAEVIPLTAVREVMPEVAIDPVCGMEVEIATAKHVAEYGGQKYYFCCSGCRRSFEKEPAKYLA